MYLVYQLIIIEVYDITLFIAVTHVP